MRKSVRVARHSSRFFLFSCYCGLSCKRRAQNTAGRVDVKSFDAALRFTCSSRSVQVLSVAFRERSLPRVFGIRLVISYSLMQNGSFCWLHLLQFICSRYRWILCWNHIGVKHPSPVASCNFHSLLMYSMSRFRDSSGWFVKQVEKKRQHSFSTQVFIFHLLFLSPSFFFYTQHLISV